jgi:hypothetical protein
MSGTWRHYSGTAKKLGASCDWDGTAFQWTKSVLKVNQVFVDYTKRERFIAD